MNITGIFSAIGNNSSIVPMIIKDGVVENPVKVSMAYKQGSKVSKKYGIHESRERAIEEYGTSAVWLGGIPVIERLCNKLFYKKSGLNPEIDVRLFKESNAQGININIDKFEKSAPEAVKDLKKAAANKNLFKKLAGAKFLAATVLPVLLMGFILPKLNFALTRKKINEEATNTFEQSFKGTKKFKGINKKQKNIFKDFINSKNAEPSFKGGLSSLATIAPVEKLKYLDYGLTAGRVSTARNPKEMAENAFKMGGMIYILYGAPSHIEKGLKSLFNRIFKTDINLDNKVIENKRFKNLINKGTDFNAFKGSSNETVINFFDKNPRSFFSTMAKRMKLVDISKKGVRNGRKYVDAKKVAELKNNLVEFAKKAQESGNVNKFIKKASMIKRLSIISNLAISCVLMACVLPKAQYIFRKFVTGSEASPGVVGVEKQIK